MDLTQALSAARRRADREERAYAGDEERPLKGYLALMGAYGAGVAGLVAAARAARRPVPRLSPYDVLLLGGATHWVAHTVAKDPVTSPLRAPFTRYRGTSGPAELVEDVRGSGARHAVGELLTCPFCLSLWVTTGFGAGYVFAPAFTRFVAGSLAALTGADLLQLCRARLQDEG
ncbi:hypothetical protein GCM10010347_30870 [Streptomyces cirratus]|uniref:DUF1360 domain-containing protein n=1 Tax=Streptomyces cirratus TaxID=68187 RepID=A0ABQ3EWZ8_9ACTN|nr:DUF1360 domain-containing protein [Streptomyces cirratus]GHB58484.1 hypothetical protein GCM10010347_30870 [Streptomyces cirratus]